MSGATAQDRLRDHIQVWGVDQPLAVGWATVDLDRAAREVGASLDVPADRFAEAPASVLLGARCRFAAAALDGNIGVVLMEPFTEGRLAAALARHDEGPIAVWQRSSDGPFAAIALSAEQAGPLGPERLEVGGVTHGPYRLVVRAPGTIAP